MKKTSLAVVLGSALLITACGSPPDADPMKPFTEQKVNWADCSPTILGEDSAKDFALLGKRLQCAEIMTPMDWKNPTHGNVYVSVIRVTAENAAKRQGAIFFNPGGPGGDGLVFAPNNALAWGNADIQTKVGAGLKGMAEQYDLIGFSPRGTGDSTRGYCGSNELVDPINPPAADRSEQNIQNMIRMGKLFAKSCKKNPVTPFINTEATVQDLNLIRQLLGEKKLNYIGYSYGTWLGSWYAKRFPESTGRMLLDGNMDWSGNMEDTFKLQPRAFERDWRDVVSPYMARLDSVFGLGTDANAIYTRQQQMSEPLRYVTSGVIGNFMYSRDAYPTLAVIMKVGFAMDEWIKAEPTITTSELAAKLSSTKFYADNDQNKLAQRAGIYLLVRWDAEKNAEPTPLSIEGSSATFTSVTCNDTPWNTDVNTWRKLDDEEAVKYPLIGGSSVANPCLYWGGPSVQKPSTPSTMPPVLMLQNEFDPATATEGAMKAFEAVSSAHLIYIDNEPQHAAFPYDTDCVDLPITDYFLTGTLPGDRRVDCQARPLPGEKQVFPVTLSAQSAGQTVMTSQAFKSDVAVRAMQANRRILLQNSLRSTPLNDELLKLLK